MDDFNLFLKLIKDEDSLKKFAKDIDQELLYEPWFWASPFLLYAKYLIDLGDNFGSTAFFYRMKFNDPFGLSGQENNYFSILKNVPEKDTAKYLQEGAFLESADGCCLLTYNGDTLYSRIEMVNRHYFSVTKKEKELNFQSILNFQTFDNLSLSDGYIRILPRNIQSIENS
jgi:hypothetical protein